MFEGVWKEEFRREFRIRGEFDVKEKKKKEKNDEIFLER